MLRKSVLLLLALDMLSTASEMIRLHPHQFVYSNHLAGPGQKYARYNGAQDYWMVSYRQALEKILKEDPSETIKICSLRVQFGITWILPPHERRRIRFVNDPRECDYYLFNFREGRRPFPEKFEWWSQSFRGEKYLIVYKLRGAL